MPPLPQTESDEGREGTRGGRGGLPLDQTIPVSETPGLQVPAVGKRRTADQPGAVPDRP